jgi:hypothetical protein
VAIRSGTLLLGRQLRAAVGREADNATRKLAAAWVKAWDLLSADMEAAVLAALTLGGQLGRWPSAYELRRIPRLTQALLNAQSALVNLGTRAGVTITDAAGLAVKATVAAEPFLIASQLPAAMREEAALRYAANIPPSALDVIVARTSQQITSTLKPLSADAVDAMNRELVRGVVLGTGPRQAGAQMLTGLENGFNGGLDRAVNVARTEIIGAYRETSMYAHQSNADVLRGWLWLCTLSPRTCSSCLAMNGREFPLSASGPDDHQQGRCTRMPLTRSWADLGIDIPEPASTIPDARAWFAEQPAETQRQILGAGRLDLLKSSAISWDDIPQLRPNPNWRQSYAPRSLADLRNVAKAKANG